MTGGTSGRTAELETPDLNHSPPPCSLVVGVGAAQKPVFMLYALGKACFQNKMKSGVKRRRHVH